MNWDFYIEVEWCYFLIVHQVTTNPVCLECKKHVEWFIAISLKEKIGKKKPNIEYVDTEDQLAYFLIKAVLRRKLLDALSKLGM